MSTQQRITATKTYAMQMLQAALVHESNPSILGSAWIDFDFLAVRDLGDGMQLVELRVNLSGSDDIVVADCEIRHQGESRAMTAGTCRFTHSYELNRNYAFVCQVIAYKMTARPL